MRFLWLLLTLVVIIGCGKSDEASTQNSKATEQTLKPLDFIIDWRPEPTYLGIYYAVDSGEFEKIGYEVTVHISRRGAHQATAAIVNDTYMIGTASGGSTVLARSNGQPIKSLGVLYKDIPSVIYGIAAKTMAKNPKDIEGMKVGIYPGSITNDEFAAFVNANNLDMDKITKVSLSGADIPVLLSGKVDAVLHYNEMSPAVVDVSEEVEAVAGQRAWRLHLKDHGVTNYGLNIITSDDALAQHADTLQAITQAVYRGYTNACANSEDAVTKFIQRFPDKNHAHIAHGLDLVCAQLTDPIGQQTLSGWQATIKLFADLGLLNEPVDPQDLMAK